MKVDLQYGRTGLCLDLPDDMDILRSRYFPGLENETAAIRAALLNPIGSEPLSTYIHPGDRVVIVHTDITRATPNQRILPILLREIELAGIRREDITLLNALGTHRKQTDLENRALLGDYIVEHYRCIQHDYNDQENLALIGKTRSGNPIRINKFYLDADIRILTGFIEPHFFAGFSGGPKGILPSIAGEESVLSNHSFSMIAHPDATWGKTYGNPIWEEMLEAALLAKPTFLLNVALNCDQNISGIFAGDMIKAHKAGCDFVRESAMVPIESLYDVVLTTNGGYPLDQNLYQSLKGISAAERAIHENGTIIMFSACEDGLPEHGMYADLLRQAGSPQRILEILSSPGFSAPDQWQVQIQAQILLKHTVYLYSDGLTEQQIRDALFRPVDNLLGNLDKFRSSYGSGLKMCVIPEGPQTIPCLT